MDDDDVFIGVEKAPEKHKKHKKEYTGSSRVAKAYKMLQKCPRCGNVAWLSTYMSKTGRRTHRHYVLCDNCKLRSFPRFGLMRTVKYWNKLSNNFKEKHNG